MPAKIYLSRKHPNVDDKQITQIDDVDSYSAPTPTFVALTSTTATPIPTPTPIEALNNNMSDLNLEVPSELTQSAITSFKTTTLSSKIPIHSSRISSSSSESSKSSSSV
ncbi:8254_t:CDS:2 [Entrophospora sp. SA101]|nr:8254_t:CDS:2 [Entrophospora sp. SA101]